ncbi:TIM barrel protein [Paractinoplanes lichenicola]|uniref:Xylose isomerase-like TIM barrel domain-containing protein n=1 Tax=Paractinoplanes lichenicola TaxID=2802976 RepID=A0ABS1VF63_9ACTN|nr:TIM barrel protein [Actinoplanes lichenicola]MBL7253345.1 hypothetical protein [Actinoplanes lichenicola]
MFRDDGTAIGANASASGPGLCTTTSVGCPRRAARARVEGSAATPSTPATPATSRIVRSGSAPLNTETVTSTGNCSLRLRSDVAVMLAAPTCRVTAVLAEAGSLVDYVQIADVPVRSEPGSGSLDWPALLATLHDAGYRGPIGLEYVPATDTVASVAGIRAVVRSVPSPT